MQRLEVSCAVRYIYISLCTEGLILSETSRPAVETTNPPIQLISLFFPCVKSCLEVSFTTHHRLTASLRMSGAILSLPIYICMPSRTNIRLSCTITMYIKQAIAAILIPVQCFLYYLKIDQKLHNYIKHNNYE